MSTMPKAVAAPRLLKAEALLRPEYDGPHELWDGVLMVHDACAGDSDAVAIAISSLLYGHVRRRNLGIVTGSSAGYVLARNPDRVLIPDAAFISQPRRSIFVPGRLVEGPPDLAVEVRSPSDSWISVVRKIGVWLAHGTRIVWAIDPAKRLIVVSHGIDRPPATLTAKDTLDGSPVLPKFRVKVARLFSGL